MSFLKFVDINVMAATSNTPHRILGDITVHIDIRTDRIATTIYETTTLRLMDSHCYSVPRKWYF